MRRPKSMPNLMQKRPLPHRTRLPHGPTLAIVIRHRVPRAGRVRQTRRDFLDEARPSEGGVGAEDAEGEGAGVVCAEGGVGEDEGGGVRGRVGEGLGLGRVGRGEGEVRVEN